MSTGNRDTWAREVSNLAQQYNDRLTRDRLTLAMRGPSARVFDAIKIESGPLFGEIGTQQTLTPEEDKNHG